VKAAALTNFNPDQVKIIQDAYELAKKTFESTKPLTKIQRDLLARAIVTLAEEGYLETERLASRAIIAVKTSVSSPLAAAKRWQRR
jgi:hypothetical protein